MLKHKVGIRGKLYVSFVVFSITCILSLWILEVWFLNDIYKAIKVARMRSAAERIGNSSFEQIENLAKTTSENDSICCDIFYVSPKKGLVCVADVHAGGKCIVHNVSDTEKVLLYNYLKNTGTLSFESYLPAEKIVDVLKQNRYNYFPFFDNDIRQFEDQALDENSYDCLLHCEVFNDPNGNEYFCMLSTMIMPVDSTVETIRFVLILVTMFLLGMSVVFSVFLAKFITKPIIKLNSASKTLPSGTFDATLAEGYREVDELSNTLSKAAEEIGKVDYLRKELLANVSHDLRTPLTLISGYGEVMRDLPGENTPENLQIIIDETNRLSELVNDLLDLSRMEAGMEQINISSVNLTELINSILTRYKKLIDKNGIGIEFNFDGEYYIRADSIKMTQVVYNLVNNAINYCGEDKKVIVNQIIKNKDIRIEVVDHGEGIPKDKLEFIWERYYKVDKNHREAKIGTGLGLSIVRKALLLHGAKFGVESEEGKGSIFWFEFPIDFGSEEK